MDRTCNRFVKDLDSLENLYSFIKVFIAFIMTLNIVKAEEFAEVTRDYHGDIFGMPSSKCVLNGCDQRKRSLQRFAAPIPGNRCKCQCAPSYPIFRDDFEDCVKDIPGECS